MRTKNRTRIARATKLWSSTLAVAAVLGMVAAPAVGQNKALTKTVTLPVKPGASTGMKEVDPNAKQPIISLESLVHDFGTSWVGPKLEYTFKITNKGTETLKITKVRPSCGCTVAGSYPKELAPGATGDFPFSVNSKKLRGKYEKSITITSNDPVNSSIRLKLRGECKRYVDVLPAAANFGRVYGSENQERVLKVTNNTEKPLELELDIPSDSKFDYKLVEVDAGMKYEIHVSLKASTTPGTLRTNAKLKTNVEAQKEIPIGATATIPKRLDVVPAQITMGAPRAGAPTDKMTTRIVRINNYGETPINILEATIDDPTIKVTIDARKEGKNYDIRLEIPQNFEAPASGRLLTIKTDDKEFPTLTVPVKTRGKAPKKQQAKKRPAEKMVGQAIPSFAAKTTAGVDLSSSGAKETIIVLDFFAVNCGFCGKQIPRVEKIRKDYEGKGIRFVAVSQTMRGKRYTDEEVQAKIDKFGFKGELVIDSDNKIGPLFKATSFPTMTILGKDGKVAAVNIGNIADLETRMKGQLDALLAGKPVPQFASKTPPKPRKRPAEGMKGKPAPSFTLTTMAGKTIASADFSKSKATVLNFVAPNCGFCKRQLPNVEKVRAEYEAKGVRFVNMSQTMRKKFTPEEASDIFKGAGSRLEIAIDKDNKIGKQFKATSYPTMMVIDSKGKVVEVNVGAKANLEALLKKQLDAIIKGK